MHIVDVVAVVGRSGFFFDDQLAIRGGAVHDGFDYLGEPKIPGFRRIRQGGEAVSVMVISSGGEVGVGDAVAVQYSGAGGRDPLFLGTEIAEMIHDIIRPRLLGRSLDSFRELTAELDAALPSGSRLPMALSYGVSQALLDAVALTKKKTMAEIVAEEYRSTIATGPIPIFVQCGDDRYTNVDKMILKGVDILPHGLINEASTKVGKRGEILVEYLSWIRGRIAELQIHPNYRPVLHFDTYGTIGEVFGGDIDSMAEYLVTLEKIASPFQLRVEHPLDAGNKEAQIAQMSALRGRLRQGASTVQLVADEWCNTLEDIADFIAGGAADMIHVKTPDLGGINNTIEALLLVKSKGLLAYCGGSCNESDISAKVSAHVAMACGADQVLAKPGMGVDEGLMIVGNEMARIVALVAARNGGAIEMEAM